MKTATRLSFLLLVLVTLGGCQHQYVSYANGPLGTIEGHPVLHRETALVDGKSHHISYALVDRVNEQGERTELLRTYHLPQESPKYTKIHDVVVEEEEDSEYDTVPDSGSDTLDPDVKGLSSYTNEELLDEAYRRSLEEQQKDMRQGASK